MRSPSPASYKRTNVAAALRVSVVVPCHNRASHLEVCLQAIRQVDPPPYETVVVDSASEDGDLIRKIAERAQARYIRVQQRGLSRARNAGAHTACGDIVAFLDDDAVPEKDWLRQLVLAFEDVSVACVVGRTECATDAAADRSMCELIGYLRRPERPVRIDRTNPEWFETACFGGIGIGPNLAIRRSIFANWSGFCERLGCGTHIPGNEEGYAFSELVRQGYAIVYSPDAKVCHPVPHPDSHTLRRRYCSNLKASTAFLLMLILEGRGWRWPAARYLLRKLRRPSSIWSRENGSEAEASPISRWATAWARTSGIAAYLASAAGALHRRFLSRAGKAA